MSIQTKKRITKKIDKSHIIWFEESNTWIQLEEPAWYIYKMYCQGDATLDISNLFSKRYNFDAKKSFEFTESIIQEFEKFKAIISKDSDIKQIRIPTTYYSSHLYIFKSKKIRINYESQLLEYMIHGSFAHLETLKYSLPDFTFKLFECENVFGLNQEENTWTDSNPNSLKRKLFIELSNLIYSKSETDWLAYIHGSAVSIASETIVLTTRVGSGKSTLAALLCKRGFKFVSDDFVPIDLRFGKAFPFPAALSVKDGAYDVLQSFYPELSTAKSFHFKKSKKTVKYISFPDPTEYYIPNPVNTFIFVLYDKNKPYSFKRVPVLEAIRRFNEEAWLIPSRAQSRKFLKWFPTVSCYELIYSENEIAINDILALFSKNEVNV